jgi:thioredoxin-related protein
VVLYWKVRGLGILEIPGCHDSGGFLFVHLVFVGQKEFREIYKLYHDHVDEQDFSHCP